MKYTGMEAIRQMSVLFDLEVEQLLDYFEMQGNAWIAPAYLDIKPPSDCDFSIGIYMASVKDCSLTSSGKDSISWQGTDRLFFPSLMIDYADVHADMVCTDQFVVFDTDFLAKKLAFLVESEKHLCDIPENEWFVIETRLGAYAISFSDMEKIASEFLKNRNHPDAVANLMASLTKKNRDKGEEENERDC